MPRPRTMIRKFVLDTKLLDALDQHAQQSDRSRSAVLRLAVREYLARHGARPVDEQPGIRRPPEG